MTGCRRYYIKTWSCSISHNSNLTSPEEKKGRGKMGSFVVQFPSKLRNFTVWASPNNGVPFDSPQSRGPVILELPLDKIRRPLLRTRSNDPEKVKELMESIREIGLQVPIDVLEVDGAYYGFSGCHRYEAHQRLGLPTIRCKVRRGTKETLRHHLR